MIMFCQVLKAPSIYIYSPYSVYPWVILMGGSTILGTFQKILLGVGWWWRISIFASEIWIPPWIGRIWSLPLSWLAKSEYPYIIFSDLFIYVFYSLIWAILVFWSLVIWQNLPPSGILAKSGCTPPPPQTNGKILAPLLKVSIPQ